MENIRNILIVSIVVFLMSPCGVDAGFLWWKGKKGDDKKTEDKSSMPKVQYKATYLDTLNKGKEYYLAGSAPAEIKGKHADSGKNPGDSEGEKPGFSIQCIATRSIDAARNEKSEIMSKFSYPVFIYFDEPYYRIRVGNFRSREDAESAVSILRDKGYPDAWIVSPKQKDD